MCVCLNVQCRLFAIDGALMPTGAEGVDIPPGINIHSSVGCTLMLHTPSCDTANVLAALRRDNACVGACRLASEAAMCKRCAAMQLCSGCAVLTVSCGVC